MSQCYLNPQTIGKKIERKLPSSPICVCKSRLLPSTHLVGKRAAQQTARRWRAWSRPLTGCRGQPGPSGPHCAQHPSLPQWRCSHHGNWQVPAASDDCCCWLCVSEILFTSKFWEGISPTGCSGYQLGLCRALRTWPGTEQVFGKGWLLPGCFPNTETSGSGPSSQPCPFPVSLLGSGLGGSSKPSCVRDPLTQPFLEDAALEDRQGLKGGRPDLLGPSQASWERVRLWAGLRANSRVTRP